MRGPPGSRSGRLPSRRREEAEEGSQAKPRKTSRLLLYIRLRHNELLRYAAAPLGLLLLLILLLWTLSSSSLSDKDGHGSTVGDASWEPRNGNGSGGSLRRGLLGRGRGRISVGKRKSGEGSGVRAGDFSSSPLVSRSDSLGAGGPGGLTYGHGTDVYEASREGEILGRWDPRLGLEIDVWDPRTHDPLHPDRESVGQVVQLQPPPGASAVPKHYLTLSTFNRVFLEDVTNITAAECLQWVEYYKYAGASHVVWYDTAPLSEKAVESVLRPHAQTGFLTYYRFQGLFPNAKGQDMHYEQDRSLIHALQHHGRDTMWFAGLDVDEYALTPRDTNPGFLDRFLRRYEAHNAEATQLLLQSFLFVGPAEKGPESMLIERYTVRSRNSEGVSLQGQAMMKPIVKPDAVHLVYWGEPHHLEMARGKTMALAAAHLRLNHYWGPRLEDWDESRLEKDLLMQPIADEMSTVINHRKKKGRLWTR